MSECVQGREKEEVKGGDKGKEGVGEWSMRARERRGGKELRPDKGEGESKGEERS